MPPHSEASWHVTNHISFTSYTSFVNAIQQHIVLVELSKLASDDDHNPVCCSIWQYIVHKLTSCFLSVMILVASHYCLIVTLLVCFMRVLHGMVGVVLPHSANDEVTCNSNLTQWAHDDMTMYTCQHRAWAHVFLSAFASCQSLLCVPSCVTCAALAPIRRRIGSSQRGGASHYRVASRSHGQQSILPWRLLLY